MKAEPRSGQPWTTSQATRIVRETADNPRCDFSYTKHVKERVGEMDLILLDLLRVLIIRMVYEPGKESKLESCYKYQTE